jgi:HlyD family secretion protein
VVGQPAPRGLRRWLRLAGVLLLVALIAAAVGVWRLSRGGPTVKFLTTAVKRGDLASTVTATGTLKGKDTVSVGAETSGRVRAVNADYNDTVTAGQVLAEIDPSIIQAALAQANAQLLAARANLKNAEATATEARLAVERTRALAGDGLASRQALEAAEAAADRAAASAESARAQVAVSAAAVESNRTSLSKTQVRSPIDGVVLARKVEVGQALVAAMTTPEVFTVARDLKQMEVTIAIDEADVGRTQVGQPATFTVDAWPGERFDGVLRSIHNVAVTKDNVVTYEALVAVTNDALKLRPGMTATVTVSTDARSGVLLVPNGALRFDPPVHEVRAPFAGPPGSGPSKAVDDTPHVWVLRQLAPVKVRVTVGLSDGVSTEVSGELHEGDLVVTDADEGGAP